MLELKNLNFIYENFSFNYNAEIEAGSLLAIIGPSGGGKSTLLDLIAGFAKPHSGNVLFNGQDITKLPPAQRPVSMVFQENNLFAHLNIATNIGLGVSPKLKLTKQDNIAISKALERVDLSGFEQRLPQELSGGQRQRVALARTLVRKKPLLLLDEPFAALGPALRQQMLALVKELHHEQNLTTLLVSHQPEDAKSTATHTAFLKDGKLSILKPTSEFFAITDDQDLIDYQGSS